MDFKLMPKEYKEEGSRIGLPKLSFSQLKNIDFAIDLWTVISFILIIAVVLTSAGLWYYKYKLSNEENNLKVQITELNNQRNKELEDNFIELQEGISNLKKALENRIYPSYLFRMIEELTLPQVWFSDFSSDLLNATIRLSAEAASYNTIAKQIVVFENDQRITEVAFSQVDLSDEGLVSTDFEIKFDPTFLRPESYE